MRISNALLFINRGCWAFTRHLQNDQILNEVAPNVAAVVLVKTMYGIEAIAHTQGQFNFLREEPTLDYGFERGSTFATFLIHLDQDRVEKVGWWGHAYACKAEKVVLHTLGSRQRKSGCRLDLCAKHGCRCVAVTIVKVKIIAANWARVPHAWRILAVPHMDER